MAAKYIASASLPTRRGQFTIHGFEDESNGKEHVALAMGDVNGDLNRRRGIVEGMESSSAGTALHRERRCARSRSRRVAGVRSLSIS